MTRYLLCVLVGLSLSACSKDSADNSTMTLSNFSTVKLSSCNGLLSDVLQDASTQSTRPLDVSAIGSMECVTWNLQGNQLQLQIFNLAQACSPSYSVQLGAASNGIALNLVGPNDNSTCIDRCTRNFAMDIGVNSLPSELDISLMYEDDPHVVMSGRAMLAQPSGAACRYYWWPANPAPTPVRGSCGGTGSDTAGPCPAGTICDRDADAAMTEAFCKPPCVTDNDCLSVESCVAGLCQLKSSSTW